MEKPRRPIAVTSRGSSRRRAMTRARSGRLSGLTLVVALLEHARDEGTTHPVVVHEQHVHVRGRRARHRRAPPSDVTRLRKNNRRLARRWRRAARRRARFARSRNGAPRRVPAPFPTRPFGVAAPNSTGRRVLAAFRPRACVKSTNESSPPSQSPLTVPRFDAFSRPRVARTDRRGTTRWPSPDSLYLALGKIRPLLESPFFGLDSRLSLFPNSPAGKWVGRRLRNQTWDPMWHGGAPGRDWLKKNHD